MRSQRLRSTRAKSAQAQITFSPHAVSVILHRLDGAADLTGDLFYTLSQDASDCARWETISETMDEMRARFGGKALLLVTCPAKLPSV